LVTDGEKEKKADMDRALQAITDGTVDHSIEILPRYEIYLHGNLISCSFPIAFNGEISSYVYLPLLITEYDRTVAEKLRISKELERNQSGLGAQLKKQKKFNELCEEKIQESNRAIAAAELKVI
jgi:hypothetical protein